MNATQTTRRADEARGRHAAGALEEAFTRLHGELLGTLFYLVGNLEDARDALQETFVKCWRHQAEVDGVANLRAWIFKIALNTGRDLRGTAWRRKRTGLTGDEMMPVAALDPIAGELERQEQLGQVRQALGDLRPEEQEVFLLRQNGEMTYEEIAHAVGIPVGTVKTRMRLALEKLRAALT